MKVLLFPPFLQMRKQAQKGEVCYSRQYNYETSELRLKIGGFNCKAPDDLKLQIIQALAG